MSEELLGPLPVLGGHLGQWACAVPPAEVSSAKDRVGVGSPQVRWARRGQAVVDRTLPCAQAQLSWERLATPTGPCVVTAPHPSASERFRRTGPRRTCVASLAWLTFQAHVRHACGRAESPVRRSPCVCTPSKHILPGHVAARVG